jgi:hypothetical protein
VTPGIILGFDQFIREQLLPSLPPALGRYTPQTDIDRYQLATNLITKAAKKKDNGVEIDLMSATEDHPQDAVTLAQVFPRDKGGNHQIYLMILRDEDEVKIKPEPQPAEVAEPEPEPQPEPEVSPLPDLSPMPRIGITPEADHAHRATQNDLVDTAIELHDVQTKLAQYEARYGALPQEDEHTKDKAGYDEGGHTEERAKKPRKHSTKKRKASVGYSPRYTRSRAIRSGGNIV